MLPGCALTPDRRLTSPGANPTQEEKLLLDKDPILVVLPRDTSLPGSPQDYSLWPPRWLSSLPRLTAHSLNSQLPEAPPKSWSPALLPGEPKPNAWFHYKKRRIRTHTHTHTQGRRPRESRGGDWRDAAQSQGTPRSDPAEAGRGRRNPPLEPSEGARSCWHFDLGTLASTTVRRQISVVLSSSVFGLSLWLPRDTPTASYIISLPQFLQLKKEIKMPISEGGCT